MLSVPGAPCVASSARAVTTPTGTNRFSEGEFRAEDSRPLDGSLWRRAALIQPVVLAYFGQIASSENE